MEFASIIKPALSGAILVCGLGLCYISWSALYNVFFHPLRRFPGPRLSAISRIPYTRRYLSGDVTRRIRELHKTYGPIVRVAPEILSICHPDAMKELRGHRKNGMGEHEKDPIQFGFNTKNIMGSNREDHARYRRTMAHAFSAQAMLDQQPIIKTYVDQLIRQLQTNCENGKRSIEMVTWYNYTTFDIIGDLAFGESFGCLKNGAYHPWISLLVSSLKNMAFMVSVKRYSSIAPLLKYLVPNAVAKQWLQHTQLSKELVSKRLALGPVRPDFIEKMQRGSKGIEMSVEEIASNSSILIVGGSETTATLLSAATYFLGTNQPALSRLTEEVRSSFAAEDEIDLVSVQKLPYMLAVLDEALRMYPPAPNGHPRKIGQDGGTIIGTYLPEDTLVEIWQWALYNDPKYFTQPDEFIPERWLGDERFSNDRLDCVQPFSLGPRNCIGRNLAYAEMRLIMARILWNFDMKLCPSAKGWSERSKVYILWEKPALNVYLTPRV
ncbi:cytochrome P450 monooxygenase, partial [Microdochium trichocladiopsis]